MPRCNRGISAKEFRASQTLEGYVWVIPRTSARQSTRWSIYMGRTPNSIRFILLVSLLLCGMPGEAAESKHLAEAPQALTSAVACLVSADFVQHKLDEIGLKMGTSAWVRYHVGSVRGINPTPGVFYVAVYSEDGLHGWLFIADRDPQGNLVPVRNGYRLTRKGTRWVADEGNGGLATYKAMSEFATRLAKSPRYRVKLVAASRDCAVRKP